MDIEALKAFRLAPVEHRYTKKDSILYALGLGFGESATDPRHLQFVFEHDLKSVPSVCVVLAHPGLWVSTPELKINWRKLLHGEQSFEIVRPLPPEGVVRGEYEVVAVEDKGTDKGAVLHLVKRLTDLASGKLSAIVKSVYVLRGDGGQGGFGVAPEAPSALPAVEPDIIIKLRTLQQSALIYRLSGDLNPIHADPEAAVSAGFPRPILHGLCSMGIATRGLIEALCDGDPSRVRAVSLRFSKPVFPGETIRLEIIVRSSEVRFRAYSVERDVLVLDCGSAGITREE